MVTENTYRKQKIEDLYTKYIADQIAKEIDKEILENLSIGYKEVPKKNIG